MENNDFFSIDSIKQLHEEGKLREYLRNLDNNSLFAVKAELILCGYTKDRTGIMLAVTDEFEYRLLGNFLSDKDAKFISTGYELDLNDSNKEEIRKSFEVLSQLGDFHHLVRWCPALLYLDKTYKVYYYMRMQGKSDDVIIKFLCSSFTKSMTLADAIPITDINNSLQDSFSNFILKIVETLNEQKTNTESFDKCVDSIFSENADLLMRLS